MPRYLVAVGPADGAGKPIEPGAAGRRFPEVAIEERSSVDGVLNLTCRAPSARHIERWLESIGAQASSIQQESPSPLKDKP